ncbi:MAG: DNRLRE domain-containing protein [Pirellulaceae bacterium]
MAWVLALPPAQAGVFVANASRDTTIFQSNAENSLGAGVTIYAGQNSAGSIRRALIGFDLSGISPGSEINSVELRLVLADVSGTDATPRALGVHKLLDDWSEGTSGWGLGPGQTGQGFQPMTGERPATWKYQFHNADEWTSLGGDYAGTASATTSVGSDLGTMYTWLSTSDLVADVQGWIDNPATNFGWLLMGAENEKGTFRTFWSREADLKGTAYEAFEPKLVIGYTAVPEPASIVLFVGGVVAALMLRRTRRRS